MFCQSFPSYIYWDTAIRLCLHRAVFSSLLSLKIKTWNLLLWHGCQCMSSQFEMTQIYYSRHQQKQHIATPTTPLVSSLSLGHLICERNNTIEAVKTLALISCHNFRTLNTLQLLLSRNSCLVTLTFNRLCRLQVTLQIYRWMCLDLMKTVYAAAVDI